MKVNDRKSMWHSITQPPLKIIDDHEDDMETIVECPHCGSHVKYGTVRMLSGITGCDTYFRESTCYEILVKKVVHDQRYDRERYTEGKYNVDEEHKVFNKKESEGQV